MPVPRRNRRDLELVGAVGGFYVQGELERGYKEKQLRAYEDYLERTSKTKKKKNE